VEQSPAERGGPLTVQTGQTLRPMPRRTPLLADAGDARPPQRRLFILPKPPTYLVLWRLIRWARAGVRLTLLVLLDVVSGRNTLIDRGRRLRDAFEWAGGPSVEMARILSARLDLLPAPVCFALAMVRDRAKPLDASVATERIEAIAGVPFAEVFQALDPVPIASEYVACTWQGRLIDGRKVAIRVRRPGAGRLASADWAALNLVFTILEFFTFVRPGFFKHLREEGRGVVEAEYDFIAAARFQSLFRKYAEKDKLSIATASKVVHELSGDAVMTTEFEQGIPYSELADALAVDDFQAVARARLDGIVPRKVAKRLLRVSWWGFFENLFFDAAPGRQRILLQADRIVFLFMPRCQGNSARVKMLQRQVLRRMTAGDVTAAARSMVQMLAPLPFIDVHHFSKALEARLWPVLFAMRDDEAPWWDRISANIWLALLQTASEFGVPVRTDTFRIMRSTLYYDVMSARLWGGIDSLKEFQRYERRADARTARKLRKQLRGLEDRDPGEMILARLSELSETFNRVGFWLDTTSRNLPVEFTSLSSKGAYAMTVMIRYAIVAALVTGFAGIAWFTWRWGTGMPATAANAIVTALFTPGVWLLLGGGLLLSIRRILFRLNDMDNAQ
jgi:ubiquinone biosynthesis protein